MHSCHEFVYVALARDVCAVAIGLRVVRAFNHEFHAFHECVDLFGGIRELCAFMSCVWMSW